MTLLPQIDGKLSLPESWDVRLLKRLGKKVA